MKLKLVALSLSIVLLSACSTEEPAADDGSGGAENTAPLIFADISSGAVDERKSLSFSVNVSDDRTPYQDLVFKTLHDPIKGSVSYNASNKTITYVAPQLSGAEKSLTEGFILQATDKDGAKTEKSFTVTVNDIDSPVKVKVVPPSSSFGFENTQTERLINAFIYESQPATSFRVDLNEDKGDLDEISLSMEVSGLFENQVKQSIEGASAVFTFDTPTLKQPSQLITFTVGAQDNDVSEVALVSLTVVNKAEITWNNQQGSAELTESAGGQVHFLFSEEPSYPGSFSAKVTKEDGTELDFNLPFTLNQTAKTINFGPSDRVLGDTKVKITLQHVNSVQNAAGEKFDAIAESTKTITLKDDRDDDFNAKVEEFKEAATQVEFLISAKEEASIFNALATLMSLENKINRSQWLAGEVIVNDELKKQETEIYAIESEINQLINSGKSDEATAKINDYISKTNLIGSSSRAAITKWFGEVTAAASGTEIKNNDATSGISVQWASGGLNKNMDQWSHYIGNAQYGFFDTKNQNKWVYLPQYAYLGVIDEAGTICN